MSMYATVTADFDEDFDLTAGTRIEVLGFVYRGYELCAVYRDDAGRASVIPVALILMTPNTSDTVLISQPDMDALEKVAP